MIRLALPKMCEGTSVKAAALQAFIMDRLQSSALDAAVTSLERKAGGLMLYARLIAEQLRVHDGQDRLCERRRAAGGPRRDLRREFSTRVC